MSALSNLLSGNTDELGGDLVQAAGSFFQTLTGSATNPANPQPQPTQVQTTKANAISPATLVVGGVVAVGLFFAIGAAFRR